MTSDFRLSRLLDAKIHPMIITALNCPINILKLTTVKEAAAINVFCFPFGLCMRVIHPEYNVCKKTFSRCTTANNDDDNDVTTFCVCRQHQQQQKTHQIIYLKYWEWNHVLMKLTNNTFYTFCFKVFFFAFDVCWHCYESKTRTIRFVSLEFSRPPSSSSLLARFFM